MIGAISASQPYSIETSWIEFGKLRIEYLSLFHWIFDTWPLEGKGWEHCTLCTLNTKHSTLHTAHCHCTLHTAKFTMHTAHSKMNTTHCTLLTTHFTLHTANYTVHAFFAIAIFTMAPTLVGPWSWGHLFRTGADPSRCNIRHKFSQFSKIAIHFDYQTNKRLGPNVSFQRILVITKMEQNH